MDIDKEVVLVSKDNYMISKESLNKILILAEDMLEWGCFMCEDYRVNVDTFRSDVLCDCVSGKLKQNYIELYKLINIVCNDDKVGR